MCQLALRFLGVRWLFLPRRAQAVPCLLPVTETYNYTEVVYAELKAFNLPQASADCTVQSAAEHKCRRRRQRRARQPMRTRTRHR